MLKLHHLGHSQSERIVWLLEELGVDYELVKHDRDPVTRLSPPALLALHPLGAAPVIEDDGLLLAESGAIVEYIIAKHGGGRARLRPGPDEAGYADYLYWFHLANGNLQPVLGRVMVLTRARLPADNAVLASVHERLHRLLSLIEARLGVVPWLAGHEFTAADIMSVFSFTTMSEFQAIDLAPWPNIRAWLQRVAARPGYQRAMAKGDPDLVPNLD